MKLSINQLQQTAGAFTGPAVHKVIEVTVGGERFEMDTYIRRLSYHNTVTELSANKLGIDLNATRIATCILDEDGNQQFEVHDITGYYPDGKPVMWTNPETGKEEPRGALSDSITLELLKAISEVNNLGKTKSSAKKTSSSTNSSSTESAAAPSQKPAKT